MDLIFQNIPTQPIIRFEAFVLDFKQASGTSRGVLTKKLGWKLTFTSLENQNIVGLGECSIIEGLSPDFSSISQYEKVLNSLCTDPFTYLSDPEKLETYPSILFGLESAFIDWKNGGKQHYFTSEFSKGKQALPINGLIWMGDKTFMSEQIQAKIDQGYSCIKMKIGAIDFETEIELLSSIRKQFTKEEMTIRVDANGAFSPEEAEYKLKKLAELEIHSIEQPLRTGQLEKHAELCAKRILPIALDEELIGITGYDSKSNLLEQIQPDYIILKPSLHGGISGTREWISIAEKMSIRWWMTSALESNIGLKVIAQLTGTYPVTIPQGLGTGALYTTNFETNLTIINGQLWQK